MKDSQGQDDLQAIRRLKSGDIGGLEMLVARYQARAVRVAFLITHDELQAEDVVQDTFVQLYRKIGQLEASRPFEPYLLRSVVNAALNIARKVNQQVSLDDNPRHVEQLLSQAASVESEVDYLQLKQQIIAAHYFTAVLWGITPALLKAVRSRRVFRHSPLSFLMALLAISAFASA